MLELYPLGSSLPSWKFDLTKPDITLKKMKPSFDIVLLGLGQSLSIERTSQLRLQDT